MKVLYLCRYAYHKLYSDAQKNSKQTDKGFSFGGGGGTKIGNLSWCSAHHKCILAKLFEKSLKYAVTIFTYSNWSCVGRIEAGFSCVLCLVSVYCQISDFDEIPSSDVFVSVSPQSHFYSVHRFILYVNCSHLCRTFRLSYQDVTLFFILYNMITYILS